jgi:cytidylate kinase
MPLITISENLGSGGMSIARKVANGLKLELYDNNKLQEEALKMGISTEDLKSLDEKAPGLFDRILDIKPEMYLDFMEAIVYEVSQRGEGVIIGHCGQMLLRDFGCALHVFIHASKETRIQNLMEKQNVGHEVAQKLIRKNDQQQNGFCKYAFQMDLNDASLYDLIINTDKIGEESAVKLIVDMANSDEIKACSLTALDSMEKLAQEKKIHAELLKNNIDLKFINIEVPEIGIAKLSGLVSTREDKAQIVTVLKGISEIKDIQSEIVINPIGVV